MAAGGKSAPAPGPAALAAAEAAAGEVLRRVRPTEASERRRAEVVDYARRLVGAALGCEVRPVLSALPCALHLRVPSFASLPSRLRRVVFVGGRQG